MEKADGYPRRAAFRRCVPHDLRTQELQGSQTQITQAAPQSGDVDDDVLGFLVSLQEGDDTT